MFETGTVVVRGHGLALYSGEVYQFASPVRGHNREEVESGSRREEKRKKVWENETTNQNCRASF